MNSNDLKKARALEYKKIIQDTPYALEKYLKTYDNTQKSFVPLKLFPDQIELLNDYENYNENITRKYRQAGVSTVTSAWISKIMQTAKPTEPHRILIIANKLDTSIEMANKIRGFLEQWPKWMNVGFSPDKNSERRFKLNNGCEVKAVATSKDALRGFTPTILVFDEAAFIEAGEDFWSASMASLSTGGKVILISTPNGYDPIYYGVYNQAMRGLNDFKITDLRWFKDPRYTKDLRWVKCKDIVHYMLNRHEYNDDEVILKSWELSKYNEYLEQGYKPFSSWFENMSKKFKYDRKQIAQELECLDYDTLVTIKDNDTIQTTKIGELYDKVGTEFNERFEILTPNGFEPFDGMQRLKKKTVKITLSDGTDLRGSYNHVVFDNLHNQVKLKDVKVGDELLTKEGTVTVLSKKKYYYETFVYDIINSGKDHFFYSNSLLSHNCDFLGSGDAVISGEIQNDIRNNMIKPPKEKYLDNKLWVWEEPKKGHRYLMGIDVSRGDSEDFSTFTIIDFDAQEQVVEYVDKIPPDDVAELAYKWGTMYNALIVIDITGGMGVATSRKLEELNYKNLYVEGKNNMNIWDVSKSNSYKIPGLNFNNKRTQIIASLEEHLRKGFIVRSERLLNELTTFVYINGRPDHMRGTHDDCIMAISMTMFVSDISFAQLERNENLNKSMLEAWVVSERKHEIKYDANSYGHSTGFDQFMVEMNDYTNIHGHSANTYNEYNWLFSNRKPTR